jgi:hypothetical protein
VPDGASVIAMNRMRLFFWRDQLAAPVRVPHPDLPSFDIDVGPFECDDLARANPPRL